MNQKEITLTKFEPPSLFVIREYIYQDDKYWRKWRQGTEYTANEKYGMVYILEGENVIKILRIELFSDNSYIMVEQDRDQFIVRRV